MFQILTYVESATHNKALFFYKGQAYQYTQAKGWAVETFVPITRPEFDAPYAGEVKFHPPFNTGEPWGEKMMDEIRGCFPSPDAIIL